MTDERRGHSPTPCGGDDPLDREIRRLLDVDPSPAFQARVRAQVAGEPSPNAWRTGRLWMTFGAAAATAALVIVVAVSRLEPPADTGAEPAGAVAGTGDVAPPSSGAAARPGRPVSDLLPAPTAEPDTATGPAAAGASANRPPDAASPPAPAATPPGPPRFTRVVFSQSETAALRRLLAQARDRPVVVPAPVEARTPTVGEPPAEVVIPLVAIEPPAEVVITPIAIEPPITIEPLNVALLDTGADQ